MKQTLALKLLFGIALTLGSFPAAAQSPQPMPPQPMAAFRRPSMPARAPA